jgi:hypothetical protein
MKGKIMDLQEVADKISQLMGEMGNPVEYHYSDQYEKKEYKRYKFEKNILNLHFFPKKDIISSCALKRVVIIYVIFCKKQV